MLDTRIENMDLHTFFSEEHLVQRGVPPHSAVRIVGFISVEWIRHSSTGRVLPPTNTRVPDFVANSPKALLEGINGIGEKYLEEIEKVFGSYGITLT